jgi:alanine racemase
MIELDDLLQAASGRLHGEVHARRFADLAFDSRRLESELPARPGELGPLFVAVKSDTGDGHDHIVDAVRRGATGVLCQRVPAEIPPGVTYILVKDTRQALLDWAGFILRKHGTQVIAVTGSSGKTVTKEAIAAVLGTRFPVFKNYASYSGRYGLPLALGRLEPEHQIAVLELAADSLNEVRDLAQLTRPSIGVLTTINQAHIDTLGSIDAIEFEKGHLIEALPADGIAVLNRDDHRVWRTRARTQARVVTFGIGDPPRSSSDARLRAAGAGYVASNVQYADSGLTFELSVPHGGEKPRSSVSLRLLGRHHIYAALAAIAVGQAYELPLSDILDALAQLEPLAGRLKALPGVGSAVLLDDTYDAELACTLAALDALVAHFPERRKTVVLGGLRQSVAYSEAYRQVGEHAARIADRLVLKGERAQEIQQAALSAGMDPAHVFMTYTNDEVARYLMPLIAGSDVVLVKGPREERMEEITRGLMQHPERAPELLVRQEAAFRHVQLALPERPTWLEVDLEAIASNLRQVRRIVGDAVKVMIVLKADGYGHGAARIARTAINNGAHMLGVACLSEGMTLRRRGIREPILVLGYTPAWQAREAVLTDITTTVFDLDTVRAFSRAAGEVGRTARVHVKVDTGMGRLGLLPDEVLSFLEKALALPHIEVEGLFTHFSVADEADKTYTHRQLDRFKSLLDRARCAEIHIPLVHAANSAALLTVPEARFDMVRLGIALYGLAPSQKTPLPDGFRPALSFKTRIAQVKTLPAGSCVSYGNTYLTQGEETIAVIPVGYADGFRRAPSNWGHVLVKGQRAPIVGRVCMDQTMIDVTHIPDVRQGDQVVLIGSQGDQVITVEEVASRLGTINYEVISEILARVPRVS